MATSIATKMVADSLLPASTAIAKKVVTSQIIPLVSSIKTLVQRLIAVKHTNVTVVLDDLDIVGRVELIHAVLDDIKDIDTKKEAIRVAKSQLQESLREVEDCLKSIDDAVEHAGWFFRVDPAPLLKTLSRKARRMDRRFKTIVALQAR